MVYREIPVSSGSKPQCGFFAGFGLFNKLCASRAGKHFSEEINRKSIYAAVRFTRLSEADKPQLSNQGT